jgi:hypothetical protein
MITIQIGNSGDRSLEDATPQWINEQIKRRRDDDQPVCIQVRIDEPSANITLATPGCFSGGGGGGRTPNQREQRIFELWSKRGLNDPNFTAGNLIAFLNQFEDFL